MAIVLSLLCSCFGGEPTKETVNILKDGVTEYFITYDTSGEAYGKKMFAAFATEYDYTEIERYYFNEDFNEKEIVIGDTDRPLSKELKAAAEALKTGEGDYVWAYGYKDGTLAFYANNETAYELGWQGFLDAIFKKDGIYFEGELYFKAVKTYEQYQQKPS